MEFIVEKFITWFKGKFKEWSADRVSGAISAYAEYLDIPQQVVSYWLAGKIKSPISLEHFTKLAAKYREGYGDRWAYPVPEDQFSDINDMWQTLQDFMRRCNITQPPKIVKGLWT